MTEPTVACCAGVTVTGSELAEALLLVPVEPVLPVELAPVVVPVEPVLPVELAPVVVPVEPVLPVEPVEPVLLVEPVLPVAPVAPALLELVVVVVVVVVVVEAACTGVARLPQPLSSELASRVTTALATMEAAVQRPPGNRSPTQRRTPGSPSLSVFIATSDSSSDLKTTSPSDSSSLATSIASTSAARSLGSLAEEVLERALRVGAADAEAVTYEGDEFTVQVRMGEVEQLTRAGSRAVGLRVFLPSSAGQRSASTSTSDLSPQGLARLVEGAVALARITGPDPFAGLPEASSFGSLPVEELGLYFEDVEAVTPAERIEMAQRCERAALAALPAAGSHAAGIAGARVGNSAGATFDCGSGHRVLRNSRGFAGEYRRSVCSLSAAPIATDGTGAMQRDSWYSSARAFQLLDSPEEIGRIAAERALRRLGARRVRTQQCPVVFAPETARSLMHNLLAAADGDAIYRKASLFSGQLGERVAGDNITLIDDGTLVFDHTLPDGTQLRTGGWGTSPYDGDGLPTRRTVIVERGILQNLMLNTYTGRKLGMASTAKASRGLAGAPGIGGGNFFLQPGSLTPEQLIADVPSGLYVLSTMGFGVNLVTGDYSQGASGLWIEDGQLTFPVEEITIAGNLKDIFHNISAIANDLEFRSAGAVPTLRVEGMTLAGS